MVRTIASKSDPRYECVVLDKSEWTLYEYELDDYGCIASEKMLFIVYSEAEYKMKLEVAGIKEGDIKVTNVERCENVNPNGG